MNTENEPPLPDALTGLDIDFIHRVYRTSAAVVLLVALIAWARFGVPAAVGWLLGGGLSLLILASVEWSVRRFVRAEGGSSGRLMLVSVLKMLVITVVLVLAFLAALRGWLSLLWMLGGFSLPGAVILLKLLGQKLIQAAGSDRRA